MRKDNIYELLMRETFLRLDVLRRERSANWRK